MKQLIIPIICGVLGLSLIITPFVIGKNAYHAPQGHFIGFVEEMPAKYEDDIENNIIKKELRNQFMKEYKKIEAEKKVDKEAIKAYREENMDDLTEDDKDSIAKELIKIDEFLTDRYKELNQKYDFDMLSEDKQKRKIAAIKKEISFEKWIEGTSKNIVGKTVSFNQLESNIKKVNRQDKSPYVLGGLALLIMGAVIYLLNAQIIPLHNKGVLYGASGLVFLIALFVNFKLYSGIDGPVKYLEQREARKADVVLRLKEIRAAQIAFKDANGRYCGDIDSLSNFVTKGEIPKIKKNYDEDDTIAVQQAQDAGIALYDTTLVPVIEDVFSEDKFPGFNPKGFAYVPHSKKVKFDVEAGEIEKNSVKVKVFEVSALYISFLEDIALENTDRDEKIILGSMDEATTNGNWE